MSISCYSAVEMSDVSDDSWWTCAEIKFYGDVQCLSVLAHPWGRWDKESEENGNLKPVVAPRKLPKNLGVQAKVRIREDFGGVKNLRCATWLTRKELEQASELYQARHSRGLKSAEIEAALGVMRAYEDSGRNCSTRLVLWFC